MISSVQNMKERIYKVLNDAFALIIEAESKKKGKIIKLEYVFQSYGLYLHEYVGKKESENVYYFITSDMKKSFITYKFKDKKKFEEVKRQIQNNLKLNQRNVKLTINIRDMEKHKWIMETDITVFHAYVSVISEDILDNNITHYGMKIGPEYDYSIIDTTNLNLEDLKELLP